eukprot:6210351-Pyramimonas_sp.AAC.1
MPAQCSNSANAMQNQCQGDPDPMPMQCRWGQSFVVDFNESPSSEGCSRDPSAKGGARTGQRNASALPAHFQRNANT